eukprot:SAG31_NODE_37261_length_305_cov_88.606796_1_plen_60_part_01
MLCHLRGVRTVGVRAVRAIEPKLVLDSIIINYRSHRAHARLFPLQCTNYSIESSFTYCTA